MIRYVLSILHETALDFDEFEFDRDSMTLKNTKYPEEACDYPYTPRYT